MKKLLVAAGLLVAVSSAAVAQGYGYYGSPYSGVPYTYGPGNGLYDYAPGAYPVAPAFGYGNWYDYERSDGPGRGKNAESQR